MLRGHELVFIHVTAWLLSCPPFVVAALWRCRRSRASPSKDLLDGLANPARWLTYSGDYSGRRHSPLTQITPANAGQLAAQWTFQTGVAGKFEATPIVIDGVLYVDRPAEQRLGHRWQDRPSDLALSAAGARRRPRLLRPGQSRLCRIQAIGSIIATLDAHLVALDMKTGKVIWDDADRRLQAGLRQHRPRR